MLPYYEELLTQIKDGQPKGLFLSQQEFGIQPNTMIVRWSDALKWLCDHNVDDTLDRRGEFQYLKDNSRPKREEGGLRIWIGVGPKPMDIVRDNQQAKTPADWKDKVMDFLAEDDRKVLILEEVILGPDQLEWVTRVVKETCGPVGSVSVQGDKLVVSKV